MNDQLYLFEDFALAGTTIADAINAGVSYNLLVGESGAGKSSLFEYVKERLDTCSHRFVNIQDQKLNLTALVRVIARRLRIPIRRTNAETIQHVAVVLSEEPGHTTIWLDEAHLLPDETISAVRSLVEARRGLEKNVSVVFCGLTSLRQNLQAPALFPVWRRIKRRVEVIGLQSDEARPFLEHLLGKKGAQRFKNDAVEELFRQSRGLPGLFVNYLDAILLNSNKGTIEAENVNAIIQQWDLA